MSMEGRVLGSGGLALHHPPPLKLEGRNICQLLGKLLCAANHQFP